MTLEELCLDKLLALEDEDYLKALEKLPQHKLEEWAKQYWSVTRLSAEEEKKLRSKEPTLKTQAARKAKDTKMNALRQKYKDLLGEDLDL